VTAQSSLTMADVGAMPALLRDTRSALVLAKTDLGNPVRLLLLPEYRKPKLAEPLVVPHGLLSWRLRRDG
jgi:hypothetical protein